MRIALAVLLVACGRAAPVDAPATILVFAGDGTSRNDVAAIEALLSDQHLPYATASSTDLDGASLGRFRLLIVPGGDFIAMGNGLTAGARATVRAAVQDGMSYLGICAGAFLAGHSTHYASFDLVPDVQFRFYAAAQRGVRKTVVSISRSDGPALDQYWEDGPALDGWGRVLATYPDGTAAVAEGASGNGWVVLTGVHPEAPASWRRGLEFGTSVDDDRAYAASLIVAALRRAERPRRAAPPRE